MRLSFIALLLIALPIAAQNPIQKSAARPPEHSASDQTGTASTLPVTRVSLYKNGVGFFEHTGQVSGNAAVTIDFTSSQLNDVLQSLTAIDLNGGRISGAGYNSTTPLEQQLKTLPLSLDGNPTVAGFYASIRGSRVEVRNGAVSITGRLLSVETGDTVGTNRTSASTDPSDTPQKLLLTVVSDTGDVRTVAVTTTTSVHLLDSGLDASVTRYLKLLDSNRSQGLRHLTLDDHGTGTRELHVSYISEVPIWKSTYRILFTQPQQPGTPGTDSRTRVQTATLQGWSVVDNTTGADWINVHLSLIAGAPQSFIQPLSQPIYSHRPEIAISQEAQLTPQTFESGYTSGTPGSGLAGTATDPSGAVIPNATITATNMTTGTRETRRTDSSGRFSMTLAAGQYKLEATAPGFNTLVEQNVTVNGQEIASLNLPLRVGSSSETVTVTADVAELSTSSANFASMTPGVSVRNRYNAVHGALPLAQPMAAPPPPSYEDIAASSFTSNTQSNAFDDFFAYSLTEPVTIRKNESALVPILQAKVDAESVTLVHSNGRSLSEPLRALWLTNNSGLTLDRGSFSIVEDGNFGGEGLLDPIHPAEKRLLSYAADQAIHVSTEGALNNSRVDHISAAKGVLTIQRAEHSEVTYVVRNAAAELRTVILEHPVQPGYTLDPAAKPDETTPTVYRFRIQAAAGETVRLPVAASHRGYTTYQLTNSDDSQFAIILQQTNNDPKLAAAIAPILQARRKVAEADAAVDQTNTQLENLHSNEDRQRANITALHQADKSARDRFVNDLNRTEDQIVATQKELDTRTVAQDAAKEALDNLIETLQLDETI